MTPFRSLFDQPNQLVYPPFRCAEKSASSNLTGRYLRTDIRLSHTRAPSSFPWLDLSLSSRDLFLESISFSLGDDYVVDGFKQTSTEHILAICSLWVPRSTDPFWNEWLSGERVLTASRWRAAILHVITPQSWLIVLGWTFLFSSEMPISFHARNLQRSSPLEILIAMVSLSYFIYTHLQSTQP